MCSKSGLKRTLRMRESHSRQKRLVISACAFPVLGGPALRGTEAEDKDGRHRELTWEAQPGASSGMSPTLCLAPFPAVVPELSLLGVRGLSSGRWNAQGSVCLFVGLFSRPHSAQLEPYWANELC